MEFGVKSLYGVRDYEGTTGILPYKFLLPVHLDQRDDVAIFVFGTSNAHNYPVTTQSSGCVNSQHPIPIHSFRLANDMVKKEDSSFYQFDRPTFLHFNNAREFENLSFTKFSNLDIHKIGDFTERGIFDVASCLSSSKYLPKVVLTTLRKTFGL